MQYNNFDFQQFLLIHPWILTLASLLAIWSLIWKGMALWKAAHHKSKGWFIALLVINTFGILEILYIYIFSKMHKKGE